ncbi:MAG: VOC family protein [Candidatus Obscuribacterales bacterium]|jgi:catechol 2,3-dioxygenase-like lactoylglutathione lyase family enzyme|nr:VOC family protein [Candidatus Obscuribacterales bacterium]
MSDESATRVRTEIAIPVLASLELKETADYYSRFLGFTVEVIGDTYAIATRGDIEIHFWLCAERHIAENTSCYVRLKDVDAMWRQFVEAGLKIEAPSDRPWGMRELYVIDPHGNLIKFGQRI